VGVEQQFRPPAAQAQQQIRFLRIVRQDLGVEAEGAEARSGEIDRPSCIPRWIARVGADQRGEQPDQRGPMLVKVLGEGGRVDARP